MEGFWSVLSIGVLQLSGKKWGEKGGEVRCVWEKRFMRPCRNSNRAVPSSGDNDTRRGTAAQQTAARPSQTHCTGRSSAECAAIQCSPQRPLLCCNHVKKCVFVMRLCEKRKQTSGSSVVSICREGICTKVRHGDGSNKHQDSIEGKGSDGSVSFLHRIDADA